MLTTETAWTIVGHPKTKGSMKCIGKRGNRAHTLVEDHKSAGPWLQHLTGALRKTLPQYADRLPLPGEPVGVEATFTLERPLTHFTAGDRRRGIRTDRLDTRPTGRNTGDVDKLTRCVLDAMQAAGAIPDDAAVVELVARKSYVAPERAGDVLPWPGVVIRLYPVT